MIAKQGSIVNPIFRFAAVVVMLSLVPSGCTSFKKLTGKSNDTVLPGQREDILPPEQQVNAPDDMPGGQTAGTAAPAPQAPGVTPKTAAKTLPQKSCDPANPDCIPPVDAGDTVDQEAGGLF